MIVWTDVETTGLNENDGHLLEIAFVITDDNLVEKSAFSSLMPPKEDLSLDEVITKMDGYVRDMHEKNGLIQELRDLNNLSFGQAIDLFRKETIAAFANEPCVTSDRCAACKRTLARHSWDCDTGSPKAYCFALGVILPPGSNQSLFTPQLSHPLSQTPLAGSTVGFDRRWIRKHAPEIEGLFSHRSIDVSSVTELAKRFAPDIYNGRPRSTDTHRALADARGSVALLRYYREKGLFKQ